MMTDHLRAILRRDLETLKRELLAYPDERDIWAAPPGVPNPAGTLALHLAGNLHHYVGAVLGGADYVRDRPEEFGARNLPRAEVLARVEAAAAAVDACLEALDEARLARDFPGELPHGPMNTGRFLLHLATHCAYHLGQVDYHRRMVCGDASGVNAQSMAEIR